MESIKEKMVLAALSQCVADRDVAKADISFILEHGGGQVVNNIASLKKAFEKLSNAELTIQTIQIYYAEHCSLPPKQSSEGLEKIEKKLEQILEKEEEKNNDNNT